MGYAESENFRKAREAWERDGTPMPYRLYRQPEPEPEPEPEGYPYQYKVVLMVLAAWALGALMAWLLAPAVLMCGDVPVWKF